MGGIQGEIHTGDYHLVTADLRNSSSLMHALLERKLVSPDVPTLFIAECVLQVFIFRLLSRANSEFFRRHRPGRFRICVLSMMRTTSVISL